MRIYSCSPQLHRLVIKQIFSSLLKSDELTSSFPQLTSLIVQLESFLSLTPSIVYLKLLGNCLVFDGKRWEDFIQVNLAHLNLIYIVEDRLDHLFKVSK